MATKKTTSETADLVARSLEAEQAKADTVPSIHGESNLDKVMEHELVPHVVCAPTDLSPSDLMRLMATMTQLDPGDGEAADLAPAEMLELSADVYDAVRKYAAVSRNEFDAAFKKDVQAGLEFVMLYAAAAGELFSSGN